MALSFPANPTNGQIYDQYVYDATAQSWRVYGSDTGITNVLATKANLSGGNTFSGNQLMPDKPAFLAYHQASDVYYGVNATLSYPFTLYNIGNAYNTSTSTFTAPVAGRYLFSANANGSRDTGVGGVPRAYWRVNGSNIGNAIHLRGSDATGNGLEQRSQTIIFNLSANDNVKIVVGENRWDLFGANFFMGYLIG
jgi:hypothetical protein